MSHGSGPTAPPPPLASGDSAAQRSRPGQRHGMEGGALKRQWLVRLEAGEERIEADEVEIMASGVLAFYMFQSRRESERTLLVALSPGSWRRCQLEREG